MNWQARDLRKIDSRIPNLVPTILVRKEAVLVCGEVQISDIHSHLFRQVNILHIRALVKADAVILFDTYGSADSRLHSVFLYHLEVCLLISLLSSPLLILSISTISKRRVLERLMSFGKFWPVYMNRRCLLISNPSALESILLSVLSALEAEMVFIRNLVGGLLAEMEDNIDHDRFKRLLHYSRRLASFKNRATLVNHASYQSESHLCSWQNRLRKL